MAPPHPSSTRYSSHQVDRWVGRFRPSAGRRALRIWQNATYYPPISASSLSELEATCILNNPKLRHDINFDRELHFRPNLDGERGRAKLQIAEDYWTALEVELELYAFMVTDPRGEKHRGVPGYYDDMHRFERRIPSMFRAAKEIIVSLNEKSEMPGIQETMDVSFMMQQIHRGIFDLVPLASYMEVLLKAHCAPMRDAWVERTCELMKTGWQMFDVKSVVTGFKELFGLLEAMKLDIANHQIRHLRPMLLDSTVGFEQAFFKLRLDKSCRDSMNVKLARKWYNSGKDDVDSDASKSLISPHLEHFLTRFLDSLVKPHTAKHEAKLPETFKLDLDRLVTLRADIHTMVYNTICLRALAQLINQLRRASSHHRRATKYLQEVLPIIVGRGANAARWVAVAGNIAVELVRAATGDFPVADLHAGPVQPLKSPFGLSYESLTDSLESYLQKALREDSTQFDLAVNAQLTILTERVIELVEDHRNTSAQDLVDAFVPRPTFTWVMDSKRMKNPTPPLASLPTEPQDLLEDAAKRAAHISILHWRVWADLVYLEQHDNEEDDE